MLLKIVLQAYLKVWLLWIRIRIIGYTIMDNIRKVIKILFWHVSPKEILRGNTHYDEVDQSSFLKLASVYIPQYSNNEIENMYRFLASEFEWHNNKIRGRATCGNMRKVNVFDALLLFSDNVLVEENSIPLCRYEHLLRWRDMIVALDEDLFVTSFLAQRDLLSMHQRENFFWSPVIGHNNKELNRLMAQGVAENHFHLNGSAPTFHLSWLSLMNDVMNPSFAKTFANYDERHLSLKVAYHAEYAESSLYISYIQAALIRLYLFTCLQGDYFTLKSSYVRKSDIESLIQWGSWSEEEIKQYKEQIGWHKTYVDVERLVRQLPADVYSRMKKDMMKRDVGMLLNDTQELLFYLPEIQKGIEYMREKYAYGQLDYTICKTCLQNNPDRHLNEIISGERWFLYEIFSRIYSEDKDFQNNVDWFYAYLLIKENIRAELIQVNGKVGFYNFWLYQNRKEAFIDGTPFQKPYLKMAVRDTIRNQHIKKLEARITPKKTAERIKKTIEKNDKIILEDENAEERELLKKNYFYVCHFIKSKDDRLEKESELVTECRHFMKRLEVKQQAEALYHFREKYGEIAHRIRGIDAASEEIGCRPEVFAQAFRYLKNRSVSYVDYNSGETKKLTDLCITFHVGEDFLDIIDGLRAIDEAISFLNMRCGDRLGHALALGVDVEEWYDSKANRILISQMDYLDNLVWLYSKIRKHHIEGCEDALRYIEKRYDEYFRIIYLNNTSDAYLETVINEAVAYFEKEKIQNNYGNKQCCFTINTYYDSWKLRGDNPEYFSSGFFKLNDCDKTEWDEYGINKIFPENYRIRYNPEAAYLFHTYHYNEKVKKEGDKKKEININSCIIEAAKKVQKKMQWLIAQKGICIETNPSSNALIGTFKRYDKHPILNWYNKGLATSTEEVQRVPQIQVSINTDDQGVFATYIENEYAYLALALEKMKDENKNPRFSRTLIYQWLDNVRRMGLVQSFEEVDNG